MTGEPSQFGPYVLIDRLGSGGMGDVYLARPASPSRAIPAPIVVIKRMHGELSSEPSFAERFVHEAQVVAAIDSPHVVRIYDSGAIGGVLYIAMEYIAGWSLARILDDHLDSGKRFSLESVADVAAEALAGLHALHEAKDARGTPIEAVHRDVAPKNIMVGEDRRTRLIDLGIGKSKLQAWKTRTGAVLGSPGYMSPEQVLADRIDRRTDIYSMGLVVYEMLTMESYVPLAPIGEMLRAPLLVPFKPPSALRPEAKAFDGVLEKALARDPSRRFQSADEFRIELRKIIPERETSANTLIGEMLWGEQVKTRTHLAQRLEEVMDTDPTRLAPAPPVAVSVTEVVAPMVLDPTYVRPPPVATRSGISPRVLLVAAVIGIPAIFFGGMYFQRLLSAPPPPVLPAPVRSDSAPAARPIPQATAAAKAEERAPEPTAPEAPRVKKRDPRPAVSPEAAPVQAAVVPAISIQTRIDRLTVRANTLRRASAEGSSERKAADGVLIELLQIRGLAVPEGEAARVDAAEKTIVQLESAAPK